MQDELKKVIDQYVNLVESDENKRRQQFWQPEPVWSRDKFRRIATPIAETGYAPVVADPGPTIWAKVFNFNVKDYYTKPEAYILNYFKSMIALFEMNDDTTIDKVIPFWPGTSFESSLFGMETVYHDHEDPWVGREVAIKEKSDLDKLVFPDFYKSGLMPLIHRFYEDVNNLLAPWGCRMDFPHITRAPYGIAFHLRGFADLAMDMMDDPEWMHKLMRFITDSRKKWYEDRAKFLNEPIPKVQLFNDEVDCNVISPKIYRDFIWPYEKELSEFHGGVAYWHSCGNIAPVLELIRQIPNVDMINISSWTDYHIAAELCPDIPLEICVRPTDDVYLATQDKMERKVKDIMDTCMAKNVKSFHIRAGSLQSFFGSVDEDLAKAKEWVCVAKKVTKLS